MARNTPWGIADSCKELGRGILSVGTPSHGGYFIPDEVRNTWPEPFRSWVCPYSGENWFEEDCAWCVPFLFCPELYHGEPGQYNPIESAEQTLEHWYPSLYPAYVALKTPV